ncbi:MAG: D-xylose transporter XylE [Bacteroidales bacterium]|nr:D-xylose transporter XylE [Bacteroidales bacterium]
MLGSKLYLFSIVLVAVIGGLLFGYDTAVISGAEKGLQAFFAGASDFVYSDGWHGITCSSALIGCIIGSAISGLLATRLGRKKSLFIAGVLFFLSAIGSWYPEFLFFNYGEPTFGLLLAFNCYRILGGIGVGLASAICPMYIAEIAPANMRGTLVSWNQFAIIFGQLVVYFVNFVIMKNHSVVDVVDAEWYMSEGWRTMFVSEGFPAGIFALLILAVPETPRFLAINGNDDKAMSVLRRINGEEKAKSILAEIHESAVEKTEKLFTYGVLVIFVGIMVSVFQQTVGINAVLYYGPRIFEEMGMDDPMTVQVIMGVVNISFTLLAVFTVEKIGRKPLLIVGSLGMAIGALGVMVYFMLGGFEGALPGIFAATSIMIYTASFMFSWGPIAWVLIAEIFPNTIRGAAVAVAVAFQWISNFAVSSSFVSMLNWSPSGTYLIFGTVCIIAALFVWKLVPETKGKTLEDMTNLWKK